MIHENWKVISHGQRIEDADRAVIMIHGRGATAESIIQLSDKLPEASYLAPQAKNREWYLESFLEPREENQPHLDSALEQLDSLIDEVSEHVSMDKIVLLGFSQGACLASEYTASNPTGYGGLVVLSGGLIGEKIQEYSGDLEETPVYIGCSEKDPHIPEERVDATEKKLVEMNAEVEKQFFPGSSHGIFQPEIERTREIIDNL